MMEMAASLRDIAEAVPAEREYSGFPWWHVLLVEPNREQTAAKWLQRVRVFVYLPMFSRVVKRRGPRGCRKWCAAIPGMLFVPREMMDIQRRDEVFEYAHVRGYLRDEAGAPASITKANIEEVRLLEAKLNLPPEAKGVLFKVGQKVRFVSSILESWGTGIVFEIVSETRIGVEVDRLFGRTTRVYVAASEIEAI